MKGIDFILMKVTALANGANKNANYYRGKMAVLLNEKWP